MPLYRFFMHWLYSFACFFFMVSPSYALNCQSSAPAIVETEIAVSDSLRPGDLIWRSKDIAVYCDTTHEMTSLALQSGLNQTGFQIGLEYNGQEYWDNRPITIPHCENNGRPCAVVGILIRKGNESFDESQLNASYPIFSLSTLSNPAFYTYTLAGLKGKMRPTPCSVSARFTPTILNFGDYIVMYDHREPTLAQQNHSPIQPIKLLLERENCTGQTTIAGYFTSRHGTIMNSGGNAAKLVLARDNTTESGVVVSLKRLDNLNGGAYIDFGKPVTLATFLKDEPKKEIDLAAELRPSYGRLFRTGEFTGAITVELFFQ